MLVRLACCVVLFACGVACEQTHASETAAPPARPAREPVHAAALEPMPRIVTTAANAPGTASHPAIFVTFAETTSGAVAKAAYEATFDEFGGLEGWEIWAETPGGWRQLPGDVRDEDPVTRLACSIRLLAHPERDEHAIVLNVRTIRRACPWLARHARGSCDGTLDQAAVLTRASAIKQAYQAHARVEVRFTREGGLALSEVQRVARELGLSRAEVGEFAWLNPQGLGAERLIQLVAESREPLDIGIGSDDSAEISALALTTNLAEVPLPDVVAARLVSTTRALKRALDADARGAGVERGEDEMRRRLDASIAALRAAGFSAELRAE